MSSMVYSIMSLTAYFAVTASTGIDALHRTADKYLGLQQPRLLSNKRLPE